MSDHDRIADLEALRLKLIAATESAQPNELAPLARQLTLVLRELDELSPAEESSLADDLAARRAARLAGAIEAGPTPSGGKRGSRSG